VYNGLATGPTRNTADDRLFNGHHFGSRLAVKDADLRMSTDQIDCTTDSTGIAGAVFSGSTHALTGEPNRCLKPRIQ
jgi:hypothetical protein